jgi:hypothetical protein
MGFMIKISQYVPRPGHAICLCFRASRLVPGPTQSPVQVVPGALPPEIKRPGHETDHSPLPSVEFKNTWCYTSITPYTLKEWCLFKHKGSFTCYLYVTQCGIRNWFRSWEALYMFHTWKVQISAPGPAILTTILHGSPHLLLETVAILSQPIPWPPPSTCFPFCYSMLYSLSYWECH